MSARQDVLCIHPDDDMLVALNDLAVGAVAYCDQEPYRISSLVQRKHKFARRAFAAGELLKLYGVPVGRATQPIRKGEAITSDNLTHYAAEVVDGVGAKTYQWTPPDVSRWQNATFKGVVRSDGRAGTANYWLIFPLVFCENRNVERLRNALEGPLGYANEDLAAFARSLLNDGVAAPKAVQRPFENLDGIPHDYPCRRLWRDPCGTHARCAKSWRPMPITPMWRASPCSKLRLPKRPDFDVQRCVESAKFKLRQALFDL